MSFTLMAMLGAKDVGFGSTFARASAQVKTFGQSVEGTSQKTQSSASAMQGAASKAALVVGGALVAGFGVAVAAAMRFDEQMSAVGAATDATAAQIDALRAQALEMGAATSFSATEAAQAQEELAKAGLSTSQILGGALPAALTLAASSGIELATASEYMADTLTQFNLSAGEAAHVADVLAAGAGKSSTDVDGLSQSLNQTALVANQMGVSLEETVGTLSLFASEGLKGSDAGTSLKTALQRLANPSAQASQLMDQLGIDVFDANGNFVGLAGTAAELQASLAGMTVEQRSATLAQLGGADAVRSLSILYEAGASGVNQWTQNVDDAGFAADQADKRLDNLAGDLEALKGSLETALIEGGSKATDALRGLVQGATSAVNAFSDLPGPVQTGVVAFAGVGGAVLAATGAIGMMVPKVQAGVVALEGMGAAGMKAAAGVRMFGAATVTLGKVGLVVGGLIALREIIGKVGDESERADLSQLERDLLKLGETGRFAGEDLRETMENLRDSLSSAGGPMTGDAEQIRDSLDDLDKSLASLAGRSPEMAAAAFGHLRDELVGLGMPAEYAEQVFDDYTSAAADAEVATETTADAMSGAQGEVSSLADSFTATTEAIQSYADAMTALTDPVFAMTSAMQGHRDAQSEVAAAELELAAARDSGNALEIMAAETALGDARLGAVESAFDLEQAELELAAALQQNPALIDQVNQKLFEFVARGEITQAEAIAMADALGIYNARAEEVPERIESTAALNDEVTTPIEIIAARLLGWDGQTGTADAFLQDLASTPMGAIQVQLAMWNASQGTADANVNDGNARTRLATSRDSLHSWNASSGTADVNAHDNASGVISRVEGGLARLDGRTANTYINTTQRTIIIEDVRPGVRPGRMPMRWGGVTNAQTGLVQAGVFRSPQVYFAEPATGGEAFIPKNGMYDRSMAILAQAADWYGAAVVPKDMIAAQAGAVFGAGTSGAGIDLRSGFGDVARAVWDSTNHQIRADSVHHHHLIGWLGTNVKRYLDWTRNGIETLIRMEQMGAQNVRWFEDLASIPANRRFANGGTVPGRIGEPQLIVAHGGEEVLRAGQRQGGGTVVNYHLGSTVTIEMRTGDVLDQGQFNKKMMDTVRTGISENNRALLRELRKRPR